MGNITAVAIANMALVELGEARIVNLTDEGKAPTTCNLFYVPIRDLVTRAHRWACAIYRQRLSRLTSTPAMDYDYFYQLPVSPYCLKVLDVYPAGSIYRLEGRQIASDETELYLRYIKRMELPAEMDPMLVQAIVKRLAAAMCKHITGSDTEKTRLLNEYKNEIDDAMFENSIEAEEPKTGVTRLSTVGRA